MDLFPMANFELRILLAVDPLCSGLSFHEACVVVLSAQLKRSIHLSFRPATWGVVEDAFLSPSQ
jgi:hypothetical protein